MPLVLLVALVAFAVGLLAGGILAHWLSPRPLSKRAMARRGLTVCAVCEGSGCYNDITHTHGTPRVVIDDLSQGKPPGGVV